MWRRESTRYRLRLFPARWIVCRSLAALGLLVLHIATPSPCLAQITNSGQVFINGGDLLSIGDSLTGSRTVDGVVDQQPSTNPWTQTQLGVESTGDGTLRVINGGEHHTTHLFIGYAGDGLVEVEAASTLTADIVSLGSQLGGDGTVTLRSGATLDVAAQINVGVFGKGRFELFGATAETPLFQLGNQATGNGTALIDGGTLSVSDFFAVAVAGSGDLTIQNGGEVHAGDQSSVGNGAGSTGEMLVTGEGSLFTATDFAVGNFGDGTLEVSDGGELQIDNDLSVALGNDSSGEMVVTGSGTKISAATVDVGLGGDGSLSVLDAAQIDSDRLVISKLDGSSGGAMVTVRDAQSRVRASVQLGMGGATPAHLLIESGGRVDVLGQADQNGQAQRSLIGALGGQSTVTVRGTSATLDVAADLAVGFNPAGAASGRLTVEDGGRAIVNTLTVADGAGSTGEVFVTDMAGVGAELVVELTDEPGFETVIGMDGNATLSVSEGGLFQASDVAIGHTETATGVLRVTGANSRALLDKADGDSLAPSVFVGVDGDGTIEVTDGGLVRIAEDDEGVGEAPELRVAVNPGATGRVHISGTDARLEVFGVEAGTIIGDEGNGTLEVMDGGRMENEAVVIGNLPDAVGAATVDDADLLVEARHEGAFAGQMFVGGFGDGELTVRNGGWVAIDGLLDRASRLTLGFGSGVSGRATVTGTDSVIEMFGQAPEMVIGESGLGELTIEDGGEVVLFTDPLDPQPLASAHVGIEGIGIVTVRGDDALLDVDGVITLGLDRELNTGGVGVLSLQDGGDVLANSVFVGQTASTRGSGTIFADVVTDGTTEPGESVGVLEVFGIYEAGPNSTFEVELAGTLADEHDRLDVFGDAILDGTLDVSLLDGFNPQVDDTFTILTAETIDGVFDQLEQPVLFGRRFEVLYEPTVVLLRVATRAPGDGDADGDVDAFDLGLWQTQFGETGAGLAADFDGDGDVDAFDLGLWQTNFGTSVSATVPEPASIALLLIAVSGGVRRRQRANLLPRG